MKLDEKEVMMIQIALKMRAKALEEKRDVYEDYIAKEYRELAEKLFKKSIEVA